jgi:predicted metalloprotease with PDZ domain
LEVNGRSIEGIEHEAVVNLIFSNIKQVDLLVVEDIKGYKKVRKQQETIMQQVATSSSTKFESTNRDVNRHRIHLLPTYKGIGLHLNYDGVINYIEPSSPAELAGLHKDQKIVEINDINVRGKTNREIASIIRENMNDLIIGVENITQQQPSKENVIDAFVDEPQQSIKPKDSVIKTLIESNVINPQPTSHRSPAQPQKIRPVDENIFMQSKAVSDIGLNLPAASSPNLSVSKGKSSK